MTDDPVLTAIAASTNDALPDHLWRYDTTTGDPTADIARTLTYAAAEFTTTTGMLERNLQRLHHRCGRHLHTLTTHANLLRPHCLDTDALSLVQLLERHDLQRTALLAAYQMWRHHRPTSRDPQVQHLLPQPYDPSSGRLTPSTPPTKAHGWSPPIRSPRPRTAPAAAAGSSARSPPPTRAGSPPPSPTHSTARPAPSWSTDCRRSTTNPPPAGRCCAGEHCARTPPGTAAPPTSSPPQNRRPCRPDPPALAGPLPPIVPGTIRSRACPIHNNHERNVSSMDNLSPGARATLLALLNQPGNVHEVAERTGRSRSGTDKALRELAKADLIVKVDGGDPADGAPARWQHTDHGTAAAAELDNPPSGPADPEPGEDAGNPEAAPETADEASGEHTGGGATDSRQPEGDLPTGEAPTGTGDPSNSDDQADTTVGAQVPVAEADEPKICRGCGEQLPRICPHCWQKTPSYCGTCRKDMPQARRGEPGEPSILPSGLPRLRPGELEKLVLEVIQNQPIPNHVGITGWTAQRIAIFLPGRSTGAIGNALDKLTKTRDLELIGEKPMRYQPTGQDQPAGTVEQADEADPGTIAATTSATSSG